MAYKVPLSVTISGQGSGLREDGGYELREDGGFDLEENFGAAPLVGSNGVGLVDVGLGPGLVIINSVLYIIWPQGNSLREDSGLCLREDGGIELRE